jgi:hypothetical protein
MYKAIDRALVLAHTPGAPRDAKSDGPLAGRKAERRRVHTKGFTFFIK